MEMIWYILAMIVTGLLVGALGRLAIPGRDPMSIPMTIALGILGSFIGGLVGRALFGENAGGLLLSVGAAALLVFLYRKVRDRSTSAPRVRP
jgi:uncharacterized membrane protein YeaQ/YmgE (transglycosylase-associated protein family)